MRFKFLQMFTGKRGDLPVLAARFNGEAGPTVQWRVRNDFTGWICSQCGNDGCDHSDAVEEILPGKLVRFLGWLEEKADRGSLSPQRRRSSYAGRD